MALAIQLGPSQYAKDVGNLSVHATPHSAMFRTPAPSDFCGYYGGSRLHSQVSSGSSGPHNRGQSDDSADWKRTVQA